MKLSSSLSSSTSTGVSAVLNNTALDKAGGVPSESGNLGVIIGGVVGAIAIVVVATVAVVSVLRKRKAKALEEDF
ncbi:hypothetical protein HDU93_002959, partial [Gonapodya sp. JEL0774]